MTQAIVTGYDNTDIDQMLDGKGYILAMYAKFEFGSGFILQLMTEEDMGRLREVMQQDYPSDVPQLDVAMELMHKGFATGEFVVGDTYTIVGTKMAKVREAMKVFEDGRANLS